MKIIIKPISSRFKRLIHDFGDAWETVSEPAPMSCFGGVNGVTCRPANGASKLSNFKVDDVLSVS